MIGSALGSRVRCSGTDRMNRCDEHLPYISRSYGAVLFVLVMVAFVGLIIFAMMPDVLMNWYLAQTLQDKVQRSYGMVVSDEEVQLFKGGRAALCPVVVRIAKGGKADLIGFRVGDIPITHNPCTGPVLGKGYFYSAMVRGRYVWVINKADLKSGWLGHLRKIYLHRPSRTDSANPTL